MCLFIYNNFSIKFLFSIKCVPPTKRGKKKKKSENKSVFEFKI